MPEELYADFSVHLQDAVEALTSRLRPLTEEEKQRVWNNFSRNASAAFQVTKQDDAIIFSMLPSMRRNFEYYLAMEYAKEDILWELQWERRWYIAYSDLGRAGELYDIIKGNE